MSRKSMFSEEYWMDIRNAIHEDINEGGYGLVDYIDEDSEKRQVIVWLEIEKYSGEEDEKTYFERLLQFFKSSISSWELNPFKKYEYDDDLGRFILYVKAENTIKRYEKEYDEYRPSEEDKRNRDIFFNKRWLDNWRKELKKNEDLLQSELNVVEESKAELEIQKSKPREKDNRHYFERLQLIKELEADIENGIDEERVLELKKEIKGCQDNIDICIRHLKELGVNPE